MTKRKRLSGSSFQGQLNVSGYRTLNVGRVESIPKCAAERGCTLKRNHRTFSSNAALWLSYPGFWTSSGLKHADRERLCENNRSVWNGGCLNPASTLQVTCQELVSSLRCLVFCCTQVKILSPLTTPTKSWWARPKCRSLSRINSMSPVRPMLRWTQRRSC